MRFLLPTPLAMMGNEIKHIIWQLVAVIPSGYVATYGQLAKMAGYPGHARYIGTILKTLPVDSDLPWHRVINSKGELSFPVGTESYLRQYSRLQAEGIQFNGQKIRLQHYGWQPA